VRLNSAPTLSQWAVNHERWIWLLSALILAAGVASYFQLPVKRFPTVQLPAVAVRVTAGATAPADLEREVAIPVEDAVGALPGIHKIWTQIGTGQSVTVAQFKSGLAGEPLAERVHAAIANIPLGRSGRQVSVRRLEVDSSPMLTYAVRSAIVPTPLLSAYVDRIVLPRLQGISGVASARRIGGSDQHLEIVLKPQAMQDRQVTPLAVSGSLQRWSEGGASNQAFADL
jgi:HAE1 family hydrophobic/amphiphilic exporter-1